MTEPMYLCFIQPAQNRPLPSVGVYPITERDFEHAHGPRWALPYGAVTHSSSGLGRL